MFYIDKIRLFGIFAILLLNFPLAWAQSDMDYLWEGKLSVSKKLDSKWSMQGSALVEQNTGWGSSEFTVVQKLETGISADRKLLNGSKLGGGFVYVGYDLFRPEVNNEYRLRQQFSFSFSLQKYRIGNRFRTEQRMYDDKYRNRWRYRLSVDFPLKGAELNAKEPYLIVSDEVLYNFNAWNQEVENRSSVGFGWQMEGGAKAQLALQYRLSKIGLNNQSQSIYLSTAIYFSL